MSVIVVRASRTVVAAIFLAIVVFFSPAARAELAAVVPPLEQITILGQRLTPTAPGIAAARTEATRVPGGANVIASDDYATARAANLADVFALSPGLFVQPRFGAEEARLSIRGSGVQRTFHLRGINLLQDGVPVTLADGSADFQAIEPMALSYTEVLRGANALQYGATTLGGAINFVSPSGYDAADVRPRVEVGSFDYRRVLLRMGGVHGAVDGYVAVSAYTQEGYRDWSAQRNYRLFSNAGIKLGEAIATRFYLTAVQSDSQLPGSLTKSQLVQDPRRANAANLAGRQKRDFDLYRLANRTVIDLPRGSLEFTTGYSDKDLWHPIFQVLQQRSKDYNAGLRYLDEHALAGHEHRLVIGVAPSWNRVQDDRYLNLAGHKGARTAESEQRSRNVVVYGQSEFAATANWTLIAGMQWAQASREYDDAYLLNGDQSLDKSYSRLSPKLGFVWRALEDVTLYGNLSDSFEPPSFGELTGGAAVDLLKAQHARTVEIGTRGSHSRWQWDVTAYSAEVRDELLGLNSPAGQPLGTINAPRTRHRGLEAGWSVELTQSLRWQSSYLWNQFRFDSHPGYGDNALPGMPEHFYRGELRWTPVPSWYAALTSEWSPRRYAVDMANSWFADPYAVWGLKLGRAPERGLNWFIEGRNLANRRYAATTGVIADARGADVAQFLPGDGRSVYVGLDWRR